ncbi:hypothetical protein RHGRI_015108 [Rhododendron griersonianum]|uniref:GST N-terminal domain-containing protein n=1 Tax=Rhododendron griersonianum TaxID=479676 RepID=A0AAV6KC15_9ERIC|nr:hypothetical protein RHGRI_015108 [Rhododendron griersonianum]
MATPYVKEDLPPYLDSTSEQPPLFDGTTRLYTYYQCPFAQRVWIARNYKGLQDEIKLVPIDLKNRPAWYKEKVYPENKVPSLEHNNKIIGESLVLLKYLDDNFEGPKLLPNDPLKQQFAEELLAYTDTLNKIVYTSFKGDAANEAGSAFDYLETALHKFEDGPFFLGQFSLVCLISVLLVLMMLHCVELCAFAVSSSLCATGCYFGDHFNFLEIILTFYGKQTCMSTEPCA